MSSTVNETAEGLRKLLNDRYSTIIKSNEDSCSREQLHRLLITDPVVNQIIQHLSELHSFQTTPPTLVIPPNIEIIDGHAMDFKEQSSWQQLNKGHLSKTSRRKL